MQKPLNDVPPHAYPGARAMVILHERQLRSFLATWSRARAARVALPESEDPAYVSLDTLIAHVCRAARGYMVWMCEVLDLPDPGIRSAPAAAGIESVVEDYIDHLVECWRQPLSQVAESKFDQPEYPSRWKVNYCVDAMLEHAVMHPLRHEFQLETLIGQR